MAGLDPRVLEDALYEADIKLIEKSHEDQDQPPPDLGDDELARIRDKAREYSLAIARWLKAAEIETTHLTGEIVVSGSPATQSNAAPIFGSGKILVEVD